ncbi:L-type lectin-domain containing receptor kinase IX.1-like [Prosopis cineraria]|uniref:L-type lectin-domain containing receptor kinase IX.1-like n=1 Tax=Prosopis cineraria TaxID=364024 RepID=UPI00240F68E3|nr:L-type lectin-domain containing receptor kinase IX.1-like [Prosopis cineraria]
MRFFFSLPYERQNRGRVRERPKIIAVFFFFFSVSVPCSLPSVYVVPRFHPPLRLRLSAVVGRSPDFLPLSSPSTPSLQLQDSDALFFDYPCIKGDGLKLEGDVSNNNPHSFIHLGGTRWGQVKKNIYSPGRVTSNRMKQLWDKTSRKLFDFHAKFSFSFMRVPTDGFAFFLADPDLPFSENIEEGGGLGLVDGNQILKSTQHPLLQWRKGKIGLFVGMGVGIAAVMAAVLLLNIEGQESPNGPKNFCHDELVTATNNFAKAQKLGHGASGDVYKGFLKDLDSDVAIKRISRSSRHGIKEYTAEVKIISQLRHRNLVPLIGWCHEKKDLLLIYKFMPNGSLDSHLHHRNSFLTWKMTYDISLALAWALLYLHEEWDQCVLHRDFKASNIMLDSNFNAKLGDFGLARLVDHKKGSQTTVIAGTRGYIAPEYFITSKATKQTDIYSFGVVLLEIASGRKLIDLSNEAETTIVDWVWQLNGLGKMLEVADLKLSGTFDEYQMERLVVVGMWCAHPDQSCRPSSITQVIQVLKLEAPLPSLPREMPVPTYHPPTIINTCLEISNYNDLGVN